MFSAWHQREFGGIPQIKTHRIDFPQQLDHKEKEVLADQQLWNQERISVLEQEEPETPQVKEEQEELCISQEGDQLVVKLEADTFVVTPISEENQQSEAVPNHEHLFFHNYAITEIQDEEGSWRLDLRSTEEEESKLKKRQLETRRHINSDSDSLTSKTLCENETGTPQLHDCKEEIVTVQQLWDQERSSSLDQKEHDAAHVKEEEEEELSISQEEEHFGLKQETDSFMVTPTDEDNDNNETEPNSEQLLSHNSPDTENQDKRAGKNVNSGSFKHEEPKKRLHRNRSDRNNQCDTDTGEKSAKCSENDKNIKNKFQKKKHDTMDKPCVCNMCGKRFRSKSVLADHERIHTGEKPFSCGSCGQSFTKRCNLKTHLRIHTDEKPFFCGICWQSFNQHGNLKSHMRIHTGEKPFSCETCGQRFIYYTTLQSHMGIHTGEKPFSCGTCGQRFNYRNTLRTHMRIHTGEKPFSCDTCGQRFTRRSSLKTHMRIHTGEKPFSCETCGQSFSQRYGLKSHMRLHTGEKPFSCGTCGQSFTYCVQLKRHMRIHM
ncbi:uncharacterized protein KZ484_014848 [Pholidichthys leucotaenia]